MLFGMQGEDVIEHRNENLSCVHIFVCKRKLFLNILMPSVIHVHF